MTTTSNDKYFGSDRTSCRYMEPVFVNGGTVAHEDDDWYDSYDVNSLLQDAPNDSIRQRTRVEREESIIDSQTSDVNEDDVNETVDVEFVDRQVQTHTRTVLTFDENEPTYCLQIWQYFLQS